MSKKRLLQNVSGIGIILLILFIVIYFRIPIGFTVFEENVKMVSSFLFIILMIIISIITLVIISIILLIIYKIKEKRRKELEE